MKALLLTLTTLLSISSFAIVNCPPSTAQVSKNCKVVSTPEQMGMPAVELSEMITCEDKKNRNVILVTDKSLGEAPTTVTFEPYSLEQHGWLAAGDKSWALIIVPASPTKMQMLVTAGFNENIIAQSMIECQPAN